MTAVRPPVWPAVQPPARPASEARSAAQKAFFQAARTSAPVQAAPAEPAPHAQPLRAETLAEARPTKILRPGSLLDIKV